MEIKGTFIQKLGLESGISRTGKAWQKQAAIIETIETYPKKICLIFMGDKVNELSNVYPGAKVTASINIESREFNGKWYTDVKCWKVVMEANEPAQTQSKESYVDQLANEYNGQSDDEQVSDDLPF